MCRKTPHPAKRFTSLMVASKEVGAVFQVALAELSTEQQLR